MASLARALESSRLSQGAKHLYSTASRANTAFPPPGPVPTHDRPARWQRAAQAAGFVLSGVAGIYSVLFYDFGDREHCFKPIRQWFEVQKKDFLTVSEGDRRLLEGRRPTAPKNQDAGSTEQKEVQRLV